MDPSLAEDTEDSFLPPSGLQDTLTSGITITGFTQSSASSGSAGEIIQTRLPASTSRKQSSINPVVTNSSNSTLTVNNVSVDVDGDTAADSYSYPYISEDEEDPENEFSGRVS